MKVAMLFPGQASHYVGMGKDYYDAFTDVRDLYRGANRVLGFDIAAMSFEGDLTELTHTHNAQPAILLHSLAVLSVLRSQDLEPGVVAGHSLGEFSALVAAGYFRPMDALLIVRKRGELMFEAGIKRPGTMAAVIGLEEELVRECTESASSEGIVVIANYNCPGQYALSGEVKAVEKALEEATARHARAVKKLQVSGAFHSPLMEPAATELTRYIGKFRGGHLEATWIANVTGAEVTDEAQVTALLSRQLTSPVQWVKSMQALRRAYRGAIVEAGPGKVLTGLMKRIDAEAKVYPATDIGGLDAIKTALA